jgi:hypothetical protein
MHLKQRIEAFVQLGEFIKRHFNEAPHEKEANLHLGLKELIKMAEIYNGWFIERFQKHAMLNIADMLQETELLTISKEVPEKNDHPKTIAIICAGNIPMVAFHDILCVLLSGNNALIKLSSDDNVLLPFFLKLLVHYEPEFEKQITFSDGKLSNFNAVIATGSNNTAGYFEYYFGKYPNIIRKNRSSVAVLNGTETKDELSLLGKDVFYYFGLGCRNVSQLLVPENWEPSAFFEAMFDYAFVVDNKKYGNNYDYNRAVYLLGSEPFLDNNFLILKADNQIHAPISVVFYFTYKNEEELKNFLKEKESEIQCVLGKDYIPFGNSQSPVITDYADNVNTLKFLLHLN